MPTPELGNPLINQTFGAFLALCLNRGIRPPPDTNRSRRTPKEFGPAVGVTDTQVRNWLRGTSVPPSLGRIEDALFGTDPAYLPAWRSELRKAYERAKNRGSDVEPPSSPIEAQIVGSISGAKGIIHIVWAISMFASESINYLISHSWIFADLVFGPFGMLLCYGTIMYKTWTQFLGTWLCVLGVILAILWLVDSYNDDLPAQQIAMGLLSFIYYSYGIFFYAKKWDRYYTNRKLYPKPF